MLKGLLRRLTPLVVIALACFAQTPAIAGGHGEGCSIFYPCDDGLSCQPGVMKCFSSPRQFDEPCSLGFECGDGLSCAPGVQKCFHIKRQLNEPCSAGFECDEGLSCQPGVQVCYKESRQLGDPCSAGFECDAGLSCQPGVQKCFHEVREEGEPCSAGFECGDGLSCQPGVQVCYKEKRQHGDACSLGFECDEGLECAPGVQKCVNKVRLEGEACFLSSDCGDDMNCQPGEQVCRAKKKEGEHCDGVMEQCELNQVCAFKGLYFWPTGGGGTIGIPFYGHGYCESANPRDPSKVDWARSSKSDGKPEDENAAANVQAHGGGTGYSSSYTCKTNQLLVGVIVNTADLTNYVALKYSDGANTASSWTMVRKFLALCVDVDENMKWIGPVGLSDDWQRSMGATAAALQQKSNFTPFLCKPDTYITRLTGVSNDYLTEFGRSAVNSISFQCSDGSVSQTFGAVSPESPRGYNFDMSCPAAYMPLGLKWASLPLGLRGTFTNQSPDDEAGEVMAVEDLIMDCYKKTAMLAAISVAPKSDAPSTDMQPPVEQGTATPPSGTHPADEGTIARCTELLQDKILWDVRYPNDPRYRHWNESNIRALCSGPSDAEYYVQCFGFNLIEQGFDWQTAINNCATTWNDAPEDAPDDQPAPTPQDEPPTPVMPNGPAGSGNADADKLARCTELIQGKVAWNQNGDTDWEESNIAALCSGPDEPEALVACFQAEIAQSDDWESAIANCTD